MVVEMGRKKVYWGGKLSVLCFVGFVVSLVGFILFKDKVLVSDFEVVLAAGFVVGVLVVSLLLAIFSLIKIRKSNGLIGGRKGALRVIISSAVFMLFLGLFVPMLDRVRSASYIMISGTNLAKLGKALLLYANDNDGCLPEEQWCDRLVVGGYVLAEDFICRKSGARFGESMFAMNERVVGKSIKDIPSDMVLLFETNLGIRESGRNFRVRDRLFSVKTGCGVRGFLKVYKDRWNQVGGSESLAFDYHRVDGSNVLFGDFHARFLKLKELADSKWSLD